MKKKKQVKKTLKKNIDKKEEAKKKAVEVLDLDKFLLDQDADILKNSKGGYF